MTAALLPTTVGRRGGVLVVDDEPDVRRALVIDLEAEGYPCLEAGDVDDALERMRTASPPPDVAIVDLRMPSGPLAGLRLLAALKDDPASSAVRVVVLSARSDAETVLEALRRGAIDYLPKPYDPADLLWRVGRAAELRPPEPVASAPSARAPSSEERAVEIARERLLDDLANPPSVEALARGVGMSARRLNDLFREVHGDTVSGCTTTWRLERGLALLRRGDLSVKEVAFELGYAHPANFVAAFARRFGDTPGRFRRDRR